MRKADIDQARAELGAGKDRAIADLRWLGQRLMGILLLSTDLESLSKLENDAAGVKAELQAATSRLAEINAAVAAGAEREAESVAQFELARREREMAIAALDAQTKQMSGLAARAAKVAAQEQSIVEQRANLEAIRSDLETRESTLAAVRGEVLAAQSLEEKRRQLEEMRSELDAREMRLGEMHRTIMNSMKERERKDDNVKEPSRQAIRNG